MKQLVILPGGFHPYHAGHYALYKSATQAFPNADVYVAATADTSNRPFPFELKQKLAKLAGVPEDRFVQVKSPFQAREITAGYDPEDTQLIFVRSDKDKESQPRPGGTKRDGSPSYLQPYSEKQTEPMNKHGYMAYLPTVEFGPGMKSATEIRSAWPQLDDKRKTALVMSLYPTTQKNKKLAATVVKMLDAVLGEKTAENQGWAATLEDSKLKASEKGVDKDDKEDEEEKSDLIAKSQKDPELRNAILRGITHYTQHADDPEMALLKYLQRIANHSTENDREHKKQIKDLENRVEKLEQDEEMQTTIEADIRPEGGMGTYSEDTLRMRLVEKLQAIADMMRKQDYAGVEYAWNDSATRAMIKALADIDRPQEDTQTAGTPAVGGMIANYQKRENQPPGDYIEEKWSEKYKRSIDCSRPRGFSQKAHCAGRKK